MPSTETWSPPGITRRRFARWAILTGLSALGWAIGLGSAMAVLAAPSGEEVVVGIWRSPDAAGESHASAYAKARVAIGGLLALSTQETRYFRATTDDDGRPLTGNCDYRIEGSDPAARWWSITAYGLDNMLIANPENRYSVSMTTIERDPEGRFSIAVSGYPQEGSWIPVASDSAFDLLLRMYVPDPTVAADPGRAVLPSVKRGTCR